MRLYNIFEEAKDLTIIDALRDFLPLVVEHLGLDSLPKISLIKSSDSSGKFPSFGGYCPGQYMIRLAVDNRHPNDILRTLAHELVHFKQDLDGKLTDTSGDTGSAEENEANSEAGVIMRHFNKKYPHYFNLTPIALP